MADCWFTLLVLLFVLEISKKEEKSSENDQLTGHFQSFFFLVNWSFSELFFFFFLPPDPKSEKKSCKSTNNKYWPI